MIYPSDIESKLGFDKIKELLRESCGSEKGKAFVDEIKFINEPEKLQKPLVRTQEYIHFLSSNPALRIFISSQIDKILQRTSIAGSYISEEEAFDLRSTLNSYSNATTIISSEDTITSISELCEDIYISYSLISDLNQTINDKGKISDQASPELKKIRQQIISESGQARKQIGVILKNAQKEGWSKDDVEPTIRNGRLVIPVATEYKRKIKGLIHDVSGTGQTVFLEPSSVVEMNNKIFELNQEERIIIAKILQRLTDLIRDELPEIHKGVAFLTQLDFIQAKALFAQKIEGTIPQFSQENTSTWINAFHPTLYVSHKEQDKKVEPYSLELNQTQRVIVISGPNAGGKSVCLKATGLIQYMFQCGIPVPMHESSKMTFFQKIFTDIGDDQSIEDDLSTYSGHLKKMKYFIENATANTLLLIDEFGTGTDPTFGGAIAEAILKKLDEKKSFGVITTHYENIKQYADENEGIVNASMQYDLKNLQPLYKLQIGQPGSSYTMQIAEKMQLPKEVLQYASKKLGTKKVDYEKLIQEIEKEKFQLSQQLKEVQKREQNLQKVSKDYEELKTHINQERKRILKKAETEAHQIIKGANKAIENTISDIRKTQADKEKTKQARQQLEKIKENYIPDQEELETQPIIDTTLKAGDTVKTKSGNHAEIISVHDKTALLAIGSLKTTAKLKDLTKIETADQKTNAPKSSVRLVNVEQDTGLQLDIRGKRPDEVISDLDRFMNSALMQGHERITILHGKGHGVLREVTRNYLKEMTFVDHFENEHIEQGGSGITVVHLK